MPISQMNRQQLVQELEEYVHPDLSIWWIPTQPTAQLAALLQAYRGHITHQLIAA